jgi:glycosyltransferase involved in cell wall biosynthesis
MKVLNIIPTLNKGGAEKLVLDICEELSLRPNTEVKLLVLSSENTFELSKYSFETKFINAKFQFNIYKKDLSENINKVNDFIDEFSPDVIHTHLFDSEIFTRLNKRDNVKYFSHIHYNTIELTKPTIKNIFSKKGLIDFAVYHKLLKVYKKVNNSFISISPDSDNFHKENIPQFRNRIHLLTNAIKTSAYKTPIRENRDKLKIISIGSLIIRKNQNFQLLISQKLLDAGVDFELNIVGDGPDREHLIKKITELKLDNNVNMIGLSNEIPTLLSQNNIFLHTASYEPFGLVLIEAMASSLPVIALNGAGNKEIVENEVTGFFIDQQDPDLFVEKILKIWNDQDEYKTMSANAYNKSKSYDIVPYIDKLIEIYKA